MPADEARTAVKAEDHPTRIEIAAIVAIAAALLAALWLQLVVPLLAAMLAYTVAHRLEQALERRWRMRHAAAWSVAIVVIAIVTLGWQAVDRTGAAGRSGGGYAALLDQMAIALDQLRSRLPAPLAQHVPESIDALRVGGVTWLREHAEQVRQVGEHTLRIATYLIVGIVIGLMAVLQSTQTRFDAPSATAWLGALKTRFALFEESFRAVVFAQVRIAAINTVLTAVYLLGVLPALGASLPLAYTLVGFTFVAGLIPVLGNLISNTAIVVVSLTQGIGIAALSLGFLIGIHKLEYFLNAHIVGGRIHTKAFELLAVLLMMEAAFGLAGLAMAPIVYAYVKAELRVAGLLPGLATTPAGPSA